MQVFITNLIREKKGIKKKKPDYAFACRAIDCKEVLKRMPAVNASEKAKEKAELGTRIAFRLSLVRMFITNLKSILKIRLKAHIFPRTFVDLLPLYYDYNTKLYGGIFYGKVHYRQTQGAEIRVGR